MRSSPIARRGALRALIIAVLLGAAACSTLACAGEGAEVDRSSPERAPATALKLALLLDFSGPLAEYGPELLRGFELAIEQINAAGGVWGMPVETAVGDTALDPTIAVEEARRLIEVEQVHAIVGPMSSAMSLAVAESVAGPARIPMITPVATSSQLTLAEDDDFLFRVSLSDRVEGRYLARLTEAQGFDNVGLLYRDDAFGQGMATAFEQAWSGRLSSVGVNPAAPDYTAELERSIEFGPQALVVIAFPPETILILRAALELGYYDRFVFGAPARSPAISAAIGPARLAGMRGTYVAPAPENAASRLWTRAFLDEHGAAPQLPYVKETYDATIALALAAEAAGATEGGAIRDQLRRVGSPPGLAVQPEIGSLNAGLEALRRGGDVDFEGASGRLDWDAHGDRTHGYIGIWAFAEDGSIIDRDVLEFSAE